MPRASPTIASPDEGFLELLASTYGPRLNRILESLLSLGERYYFRLNTLTSNHTETLYDMRSAGIDVRAHEQVSDAAYVQAKETMVSPKGTTVEADRFAAEAVLQGAHLHAPGVRSCKGLRAGAEASVVDPRGNLAGCGIARQGETSILTYRQGVAVEARENPFGLPSFMDTPWHRRGQIHLQSLPSILTCQVLAPNPGEMVVDLNCAPGGKMSYLCQLAQNSANIIGFDRNERKLEKTSRQLQRLGCKNYRLISHDSRYAHLDFTFRADKVLVDPPCTGLGVTPKLSVETKVEEVNTLASYQRQFLSAAGHIAKRGGTIVYSVCTITREECEDVVRFATEHLRLRLREAIPIIGNQDWMRKD